MQNTVSQRKATIQAELETDGRQSHLFRFQTCVKLRLNAIRPKTKIPESIKIQEFASI